MLITFFSFFFLICLTVFTQGTLRWNLIQTSLISYYTFSSGKSTAVYCQVQIFKKTSGFSLKSGIMWPDLFEMKSFFYVYIIAAQRQSHVKSEGKWPFDFPPCSQWTLGSQEERYVAKKKPWLTPNWHNIFLKHHRNKSRICRDFNTYNENNVSYFEVNIN